MSPVLFLQFALAMAFVVTMVMGGIELVRQRREDTGIAEACYPYVVDAEYKRKGKTVVLCADGQEHVMPE